MKVESCGWGAPWGVGLGHCKNWVPDAEHGAVFLWRKPQSTILSHPCLGCWWCPARPSYRVTGLLLHTPTPKLWMLAAAPSLGNCPKLIIHPCSPQQMTEWQRGCKIWPPSCAAREPNLRGLASAKPSTFASGCVRIKDGPGIPLELWN